MTIKMQFQVQRVQNAIGVSEDSVEAAKFEDSWVNPKYGSCRLTLQTLSDDELKKFQPGQLLQVTIETS